ncbi:hypothetical protein ACQ4M3_37545 [Leptolyngbya sp. AN03gr2]|uniref:hypothetical protein n=1 Tax=unclassified Leptolyngbya TaxID=2650499 RepID=UPI003D310D61
MSKISTRVGWLVPGQTILVNGQILPIQDCQVVLTRQKTSPGQTKITNEDQVAAVEFWFNRPIQGATAYIPIVRDSRVVLTQVTQLDQVQNWKDVQWLVIVSGDAAIAVRHLILQLAKQNTPNPPVPKQTKTAPPVPKSIPTPDARKYQIIVKNQPKPHKVDLNVLDFIDSDPLDLDDE